MNYHCPIFQGKAASKAYNANLREQTVRWGMIEMIQHPPGTK